MRKGILAAGFAVLLAGGVYAQGMPVIDLSRVLIAIEEAFILWDQLDAAVEQVQNTFDQLERTAKAFREYKPEEFDWSDPKKLKDNLRGSMRSVMTYTDDMMNLEEKMGRLIKAKDLKIGKIEFSWWDVAVAARDPEGAMEDLKGIAGQVYKDPFDPDLSDADKAKFYSKFGLSPANFYRVSAISEMVTDKALSAVAYDELQNELRKERSEAASQVAQASLFEESETRLNANEAVMLSVMEQNAMEVAFQLQKYNENAILDFYRWMARRLADDVERVGNPDDLPFYSQRLLGIAASNSNQTADNFIAPGDSVSGMAAQYGEKNAAVIQAKMKAMRDGIGRTRDGVR